ncbi:BTAD domain-containing putative transcriptional regulator [Streptomyces sp. ODS28]|uniref:AfsR/SARP family transcriptional regulator n=1 Tax=Streptomyces sp. ODS28 TaxID=3136688 RepID=UPI0031EC7787
MFSGQEEIAVGHPKQRSVLAALLVNVNQSVSTAALIDQVWGENPPATVRSALYTYIAQLRKVLLRAGIRLSRRSQGYVLETDPATIDLHRFRRLADSAGDRRDAHAAHALSAAIELWRGEPFEGLSTPWLDAARATALAEYRAVLVRRNDILLARGQHSDLLPELLSATAESPLDESLTAQLIVALLQSGQRASALERYHRLRHALAEEMGIDPSAPLQDLYRQMLGSLPHTALRPPHSPAPPSPAPQDRQVAPRTPGTQPAGPHAPGAAPGPHAVGTRDSLCCSGDARP